MSPSEEQRQLPQCESINKEMRKTKSVIMVELMSVVLVDGEYHHVKIIQPKSIGAALNIDQSDIELIEKFC